MRRRGGRGRRTVAFAGAVATLVSGWGAAGVAAQELADFDYENLSFRGVGLEVGRLWANRVDDANLVGLRVDLGYLGPGVRIVPSLTYWSSSLVASEVADLEASLERLVEGQTGDEVDLDLGPIDWADLKLGLDGQMVWSVPLDLLTFAGLGGGVHFMNGSGEAIGDTFVEDLLDSARAGFNVHVGVEAPWDPVRLYGTGRFETLEDLSYFELRFGGQLMVGPAAPGEIRAP